MKKIVELEDVKSFKANYLRTESSDASRDFIPMENDVLVKFSDLESCPDFPVTLEEIKETIGVGCTECKKALKLSIMTQIHIGLTHSSSFTSEATGLIMENVDISVSKIIDNMEVK